MIRHQEVETASGTNAILVDSISFVTEADTQSIVVCASHGGASSGEYASKYRLGLVVFNDAGVGKDNAGIQALTILEQQGVAACAVSHNTARIGDVLDQWENGIISHVNAAASASIQAGLTVREAVNAWANRPGQE
ncbi:hypothetical protein LFT48_20215 [Arthrobacter sp. FW305-123]|nr:hypothetical protein LFT48_20215 [Arthrobacter sp. FW305-123]